jgi:hypothetical protein
MVNQKARPSSPLTPIISTLTGGLPATIFTFNTYAYPGGGGYPCLLRRPIDPLSRSFYHAVCGAISACSPWSHVHA